MAKFTKWGPAGHNQVKLGNFPPAAGEGEIREGNHRRWTLGQWMSTYIAPKAQHTVNIGGKNTWKNLTFFVRCTVSRSQHTVNLFTVSFAQCACTYPFLGEALGSVWGALGGLGARAASGSVPVGRGGLLEALGGLGVG